MSHAYHPSCPCYVCGKASRQDERAEEATDSIIEQLMACPAIHAETALDDDRAALAAAAAKDGDLAELGRIVMDQVRSYVEEMIVARADLQSINLRAATRRHAAATELFDTYLRRPH